MTRETLVGIGMPTFEDKVLQRAVAMVLETIYEQDFSDCSFVTDQAAQRIKPWKLSDGP
jgi:retron-type reverse transcriptase